MNKFTDPIRDLRRCRFCGLDTIEAACIEAHEEGCIDNPDNECEVEYIDPEGDRGPNYLPDPDLDDLPSDAFEDWRDDCDFS